MKIRFYNWKSILTMLITIILIIIGKLEHAPAATELLDKNRLPPSISKKTAYVEKEATALIDAATEELAITLLPSKVIQYQLGKKQRVKLDIYTLTGEHAITLTNRIQGKGKWSVKWNGYTKSGQKASTGIYFFCFRSNDECQYRKFILM